MGFLYRPCEASSSPSPPLIMALSTPAPFNSSVFTHSTFNCHAMPDCSPYITRHSAQHKPQIDRYIILANCGVEWIRCIMRPSLHWTWTKVEYASINLLRQTYLLVSLTEYVCHFSVMHIVINWFGGKLVEALYVRNCKPLALWIYLNARDTRWYGTIAIHQWWLGLTNITTGEDRWVTTSWGFQG